MGNIPAPYLTALSGLNRVEAEVINKFSGKYGDNAVALAAAITDMCEGLQGIMTAPTLSTVLDPFVTP